MKAFDLRLGLCVLGLALGAALAWHVATPRTYVASARVLLAKGGTQSRVLKLESSAQDAAAAQSHLAQLLANYSAASVLDAPTIVPARQSLALELAIGGAFGLVLGGALTFWQSRRRRPVQRERELLPLLGDPLLAARPLGPEALRALAHQLRAHWFSGERKVLPIVSAGKGDGRSSVAVQLAKLFAEMGERTLLVDANLRSPSLHRAFGLKNERGLADLLADRPVQLAACGDNLALLVAGAAGQDPLELLSRARLTNFLQAAARPFSVVLVDTPAAASGPDLEIFAALAGGALLVVRPGEDATRLSRLRRRLTHCKARPVGTVFSRR